MIPDPSTAENPFVEGGSGRPAGEPPAPRPGYLCAGCGQPISADLQDMVVFASPTTIAYLPCLFASPSPRRGNAG